MTSEWQETTVGDFCPFKYGKGLPERDRIEGEYPVYSSAGLVGSHTSPYVNGPGVIIGRKGTVGTVTYSHKPFWPIDTAFFIEDYQSKRDLAYTYYLLKTLGLHLMNTDSAVPGLNRENAHALKVKVPPLSHQIKIGKFLSRIDERINLLHETNVTLEAIPKAIFKSWFVDFDPTISKVEGKKQQNISAEIESLFPNSFEQTELGKLPKGWKVEWLSDVFDFKEGPGIRNWQYTNTEEGTRFINIRCIQKGDLEVGTANRISDVEANGKYAHFHLQEWDVVVSTSGTLGRSGIVRKEHLPLMLNTSVIRFRPISHKTTFGFVYCYINAPEFLYKIESMASGSVQKNFGPMHLNQIKMICPNFELMEYFDNLTKPLFEKLIANRRHIENLVELRDALIPRLVSGQINDLEKMKDSEKRLTEHL